MSVAGLLLAVYGDLVRGMAVLQTNTETGMAVESPETRGTSSQRRGTGSQSQRAGHCICQSVVHEQCVETDIERIRSRTC